MRQITILASGKMKDKALESLQQEYCKRLQAFCEVRILEVKDEANEHTDRPGEAGHAKDLEAGRALEKIRPGDFVILLDLHGTEWTSEEFSERLGTWADGSKNLVFVIAGSLGPGQALLQRADVRWKLSDLTFTHLMTRVLLLEQIYRGFMIRAGRSYHK
jgi:23S rRNA (pseudouridine1915-N3)-methyltransferase